MPVKYKFDFLKREKFYVGKVPKSIRKRHLKLLDNYPGRVIAKYA